MVDYIEIIYSKSFILACYCPRNKSESHLETSSFELPEPLTRNDVSLFKSISSLITFKNY